MSRSTLAVFTLVVALACGGSSTAPPRLGSLQGEVIAGDSQRVVARLDQAAPDRVIYRAYRELLAIAYPKPSRFEQLVLPAFAYAQQAKGIQLQPNAVACVGEDQSDLLPFSRCVNTDSLGQARFDFVKLPTKAGRYVAKLNAVYGLEATTFDSVVVNVEADVFDHSPLQTGALYLNRVTPVTFQPGLALDKYDNAVPYRFEFVRAAYAETSAGLDTGLTIFARSLSDTLGTTNARTIVIDSIVGPTSFNGRSISRVCGEVDIVTKSGVSLRAMYRTQRMGNGNGTWPLDLLLWADLSKMNSCSP